MNARELVSRTLDADSCRIVGNRLVTNANELKKRGPGS
jgi:hypothetical protein